MDSSTPLFKRLYSWPRVRLLIIGSVLFSLLWSTTWVASAIALWWIMVLRVVFVAFIQLSVFGLLEHWPSRLPRWMPNWVLQIIGVAIAAPLAAAFIYTVTTFNDPLNWHLNANRLFGFGVLTAFGVLVSPWIAMSALYRKISGQAQRQQLAFELERSEFARDSLDSRLRLLQAQVEPHFLFNTLANIRELVDSGSPQASTVLNSLIAYLRAAVPRLNDASTTLGQELDLVRSYLELMHMRMPDRLQFSLEIDDAALIIQCPPMTLLTLVENAIRHGIDPSEEGGHITISARIQDGRCLASVADTGVGLGYSNNGGLGTGLATLRERLQLAFSGDAELHVGEQELHGVIVEIDFPAIGIKS